MCASSLFCSQEGLFCYHTCSLRFILGQLNNKNIEQSCVTRDRMKVATVKARRGELAGQQNRANICLKFTECFYHLFCCFCHILFDICSMPKYAGLGICEIGKIHPHIHECRICTTSSSHLCHSPESAENAMNILDKFLIDSFIRYRNLEAVTRLHGFSADVALAWLAEQSPSRKMYRYAFSPAFWLRSMKIPCGVADGQSYCTCC